MRVMRGARVRVENFFGGLKNRATVIISADEEKLRRMGLTKGPALTSTWIFGGTHSYVVLSLKGIDVDVAAHELTHAELHERLYRGKLVSRRLVPVWFDEGLTVQNDYRIRYGEKAYEELMDRGGEKPTLGQLESGKGFQSADDEQLRQHYIISAHEVRVWIQENGREKLTELLDEINRGKRFDEIYGGQSKQ